MSSAVAHTIPALIPTPRRGAETQLTVHIAHDGDTVVVRLSGALSGPRVPLFESVVYRLEKRGRTRFTLDLRQLAVLDAAGAALVRRFKERALRAGRSTTVLGGEGE